MKELMVSSTCTSPFLHEFVDKNGNADRVNRLSCHKKIIMVDDHKSKEDQSQYSCSYR